MSRKKTILLCENPAEARGKYDMVVYWASFESAANTLSIPEIVEKEAEPFKEKYLNWLHGLGNTQIDGHRIVEHLEIRDGFSFWWMSLIVEKSQWKSKELYNVFRLLALEELIQKQDITKIIIAIDDKVVRKVIRHWCQEVGIDFINKRVSSSFIPLKRKRLFYLMPFIFQAMASLLKYIILHWPMRHAHCCSKQKDDIKGMTFISYLFNFDQKASEKGKFYSKYWNSLHDLIEESKRQICWAHIFIKNDAVPNSAQAVKITSKFNLKNKSNQIHSLIDCYLGWGLVKRVLKDYFRIWLISRRLGKIQFFFRISGSKMNFWPVLEKDWKHSLFGTTAISNCLFLNLFETFIAQLPHQEKGVYLLENQSWERSLIYAWQKAGHGQLIGVQHTAVSFWDLRHFFSPLEYNNKDRLKLPIPDKVALNGDAAVSAYQEGGFPEDRILKMEALRYMYLDPQHFVHRNPRDLKANRLLVLGDYLPDVTNKQMKLLSDAAADFPKNIKILVKAHPACPINLGDWPSLDMYAVNKPLDQLVNEYDIAFTSNATAAALDSYISGKTVLIMLDPDSFNMSPLRTYPGVQFVATSVELVQGLSIMDVGQGNNDKAFFYTNPELPQWRSLINESGNA